MSEENESFLAKGIVRAIEQFSQNDGKKVVVLHFGDAQVIIAPDGFWDEYMQTRSTQLEAALEKMEP